MARHLGRQGEWPKVTGNPTAIFTNPDGYLKSTRSVAGPLRLGTEPRIGPKGALGNGTSDYGTDRISPRGFDPIGTALNRYGPQEASPLVSTELRGEDSKPK